MRHDLTSLKIFVTVAECGNLTRAAEREHLAVSAISKRMAELESTVGTPLLLRYPRGVGLTPAGQSLLHHAQQMMQLVRCMDAELAEYVSGTRGYVRIHAMPSALMRFLPADIESFMARHPLVHISLESRLGQEIVAALHEGSADVGIVTNQMPLQGLTSVPYHQDSLMVAVPLEHPLTKRKAIRFADALDYPFIGPRIDSSLSSLMLEGARACGKPIQQRIHASGIETTCQLVELGMGIAVLSKALLAPHVEAGRVCMVALKEKWARRQMLIVTRHQAELNHTTRSLIDHLQRAVAKTAQ